MALHRSANVRWYSGTGRTCLPRRRHFPNRVEVRGSFRKVDDLDVLFSRSFLTAFARCGDALPTAAFPKCPYSSLRQDEGWRVEKLARPEGLPAAPGVGPVDRDPPAVSGVRYDGPPSPRGPVSAPGRRIVNEERPAHVRDGEPFLLQALNTPVKAALPASDGTPAGPVDADLLRNHCSPYRRTVFRTFCYVQPGAGLPAYRLLQLPGGAPGSDGLLGYTRHGLARNL